MRHTSIVLLLVAALLAVEPAATALAAKQSVTVKTNRGRVCTVYVSGDIANGYFRTNGVISCGQDPTYGATMERLTVNLTTTGTFLISSANGTGQASCQWAYYCEAWRQHSGTLPGMTYTVSGYLTLDGPDYPWADPEEWTSWPSSCRRGGANELLCNLRVSETEPLPLPPLPPLPR